jgi:hypothetical protein
MMKYRQATVFVLVLCTLFGVTTAGAQQSPPTKTPIAPQATEEIAPPATQEAAPPAAQGALQLTIDLEPIGGMRLVSTSTLALGVEENAAAGGDRFVALGGDCASGYAAQMASLGIASVIDTGPVQIGFEAFQPNTNVTLIMWDFSAQEWWCNFGYAADHFLEFENLAQGIYFVWVLTETPTLSSGRVYVRSAS